MKRIACFFGILILLMFVSCSSQPQVTRVPPGSSSDLSGYWSAVDIKEACEALINDCLNSPRVAQTIMTMRRPPVVLVGLFRNESDEQIDTAIISSTMETVIFNSGKMDFVAGGGFREQLRAERQSQQINASEETAARLANETGADFMLFGTVRTVVDRAGNRSVRTYYVNAEMSNIETTQRMWMGDHQIQKEIVQPRNRL